MENQGLYVKYDVRKVDTGELVNNCFVLRPDKDQVAVFALLAYAEMTSNRTLAADIYSWLNTLEPKRNNLRNLLGTVNKDPDKMEKLLEKVYEQYMDDDGGCFMEAKVASQLLSGIGQAVCSGAIENEIDELGFEDAFQKVTVDREKDWWTPEKAEDQDIYIASQI